jgi:hypothetical protein
MTRDEALALLRRKRSAEWNAYRKANPAWIPDLSGEDLSGVDLAPANGMPPFDLSRAILLGTKFSHLQVYLATSEANEVRLQDAIMDIDTSFPKGFDPIRRGARFLAKSQTAEVKHPAQFSAFISYAWVNEDVVTAIDQWLRLKGVGTRIDRRDFFAGARIRDEILRVMSECNVVLIFYSHLAAAKAWPQFERELVGDIEMTAKVEGREAPRIIYVVIDDTPLPSPTEKNKLAVMARGKRFELVCEEIYHAILQIPASASVIDLSKWSDYTF